MVAEYDTTLANITLKENAKICLAGFLMTKSPNGPFASNSFFFSAKT